MNFNKAKIVLRDAAFRIGNELFVQEALKKIGKIQADANIEGAKKELDLVQFVEELFDYKYIKNEKYNDFWELIGAIAILDKYQKKHSD